MGCVDPRRKKCAGMTSFMGRRCQMARPPIVQRIANLVGRFAPTEEERAEYREEWMLSDVVPRFLKCSDCSVRSFKRISKRRTQHGVFCREHYVNHPRCTVAGCDNLAEIDPDINPDMICRDHLFPDNTRPTPTWKRSMIAGATVWAP